MTRAGLLMVMLATGACSREPDCAEVARHVAEIAAREDAAIVRSSTSPPNQFTPLFGEYAAEIGAQCERGDLSSEARRCFLDAKSGSDLDRCGHRGAP